MLINFQIDFKDLTEQEINDFPDTISTIPKQNIVYIKFSIKLCFKLCVDDGTPNAQTRKRVVGLQILVSGK